MQGDLPSTFPKKLVIELGTLHKVSCATLANRTTEINIGSFFEFDQFKRIKCLQLKKCSNPFLNTVVLLVNGAGFVRGGVPFQTHLLRHGEDHEVAAGSARNISIDRHCTFAALQCGVQGRRES